jgi:hypothetical protein
VLTKTAKYMNEKQSTNYTSLVDMEKEKVKNIIYAFWRGDGISKSLLTDRNCIHIRKDKVQLWNEV